MVQTGHLPGVLLALPSHFIGQIYANWAVLVESGVVLVSAASVAEPFSEVVLLQAPKKLLPATSTARAIFLNFIFTNKSKHKIIYRNKNNGPSTPTIRGFLPRLFA